MNTDCENFILLLQEQSEIVLGDSYKEHLASCGSCRRLLESHDCSFGRLKTGLLLPATTENAILIKVQKMIVEEKCAKDCAADFSFLSWLNSWRLQVALAGLLIVIVAGVWHFNYSRLNNAMQISGSAVVLKNFKKITLENTAMPFNHGERLTLLNGQMDLCWQDSANVSIIGMLDFTVQEKNIIAKSGQATLIFLPAASGYTVTTRLASVKILGTTVRIELNENHDAVSVLKGKVEWSLLDGSKKCELNAGTRIIVQKGQNGLQVVEESCPTNMPDNDSNQLFDMNDGLGVRKTGDGWKPLNED